MPLQFQKFDIPLAAGIDSKTDPKQAAGLLEVKNAYVERNGEVRKRGKARVLKRDITTHTSTVDGTAGSNKTIQDWHWMFARDGRLFGQVVADDGIKGVEYTPNGRGWRELRCSGSTPVDINIVDTGVSHTDFQSLGIDVAYNNGLICLAAVGQNPLSGGGYEKFLQIYDAETGALVLETPEWTYGEGHQSCRVIACGDYFIAAFGKIDEINAHTIDTTKLDAWDDGLISTSAASGYGFYFDIAWVKQPSSGTPQPEASFAVAFRRTLDNYIEIRECDALTLTNTHVTVVHTGEAHSNTYPHLHLKYAEEPDGSPKLLLFYSEEAADDWQFKVWDTTTDPYTEDVAATQIVSAAASNIQMTWAEPNASYWADSTEPKIWVGDASRTRWVDTGGATGTGGSRTLTDRSPLAGPINVGTDSYALYGPDTSKSFVVNGDGDSVLAHLFHLRKSSGDNFTEAFQIDDDKWGMVCFRDDRAAADGELVKSIRIVTLNFAPSYSPAKSLLGKTTVISGGQIMQMTDAIEGVGHVEIPDVNSGPTQVTGGSMADGTYKYHIIYEWMDATGDIHRSVRTAEQSITVSAGSGTAAVRYTMNSPWFSSGGTGNLSKRLSSRCIILRTEDAGSLFYKTGAWGNFLAGSATTQIDDTPADASITSNEALYTESGELEVDVPPGARAMAAGGGRVFVAPYDEPSVIWFSKEKVAGFGLEFSASLKLDTHDGGPVTALGYMDGKLIIFKRDKISFLSGSGPNAKGQGAFSPIAEIVSDVGCTDPGSLVLGSNGYIFKSAKGFYLLDRGLQTQYIGAPVERFNDYTVRCATMVAPLNQIRMCLNEGPILAYDYYHNVWSELEVGSVRDATVWNNEYAWCERGAAYVEEQDKYDEESKAYIQTGWISLTRINGYQRFRWLHILGEFARQTKLRLHIDYDYNEDRRQTVDIDIDDESSRSFRVKPAVQKCQAMRVTITERVPAGKLRLSGLSLDVGLKKGSSKLSSAVTG